MSIKKSLPRRCGRAGRSLFAPPPLRSPDPHKTGKIGYGQDRADLGHRKDLGPSRLDHAPPRSRANLRNHPTFNLRNRRWARSCHYGSHVTAPPPDLSCPPGGPTRPSSCGRGPTLARSLSFSLCIYKYVYIQINMCIHIHIYTYIRINVNIYIYIYVYMYIYHMLMNIYIYTAGPDRAFMGVK